MGRVSQGGGLKNWKMDLLFEEHALRENGSGFGKYFWLELQVLRALCSMIRLAQEAAL